MMPEHDIRLIEQAKKKSWVDINEEDADSEEGRAVLHDIALRKYHREEYWNHML